MRPPLLFQRKRIKIENPDVVSIAVANGQLTTLRMNSDCAALCFPNVYLFPSQPVVHDPHTSISAITAGNKNLFRAIEYRNGVLW